MDLAAVDFVHRHVRFTTKESSSPSMGLPQKIGLLQQLRTAMRKVAPDC
jgi:hypothetical protein